MSDKAFKDVTEIATRLALLTHHTRSTEEQKNAVLDLIGPTMATLCDIFGLPDTDVHTAMVRGKRARLAVE